MILENDCARNEVYAEPKDISSLVDGEITGRGHLQGYRQ